MTLAEVRDHCSVGRAPEAADGAGEGHFHFRVAARHVVDQTAFCWECLEADLACVARSLPLQVEVEVSVQGDPVVKLLEAEMAEENVHQVRGESTLALNVQTEMPHKLDVVQEEFLAHVAPQAHVRLELVAKNLEQKMTLI